MNTKKKIDDKISILDVFDKGDLFIAIAIFILLIAVAGALTYGTLNSQRLDKIESQMVKKVCHNETTIETKYFNKEVADYLVNSSLNIYCHDIPSYKIPEIYYECRREIIKEVCKYE